MSATVSVVLYKATSTSSGGAIMPVPNGSPVSAKQITSSGTSQDSTVPAVPSDTDRYFWRVTPKGGSIWAKFASGTNTAAPGADWLCIDSIPVDFGAAAGQTCSVIDAP